MPWLGSRGGGDGTLALITKSSKINYIRTKLIYSHMHGLKFQSCRLARMSGTIDVVCC
jgi:hypothetical protein